MQNKCEFKWAKQLDSVLGCKLKLQSITKYLDYVLSYSFMQPCNFSKQVTQHFVISHINQSILKSCKYCECT